MIQYTKPDGYHTQAEDRSGQQEYDADAEKVDMRHACQLEHASPVSIAVTFFTSSKLVRGGIGMPD